MLQHRSLDDMFILESVKKTKDPSVDSSLLPKSIDSADLNELLITDPDATFFVRVFGNAMTGIGIYEGDLLIIDRNESVKDGHVIVALFNGKLIVRKLYHENQKAVLVSANPEFSSYTLKKKDNLHIWGVVIYTIHSL